MPEALLQRWILAKTTALRWFWRIWRMFFPIVHNPSRGQSISRRLHLLDGADPSASGRKKPPRQFAIPDAQQPRRFLRAFAPVPRLGGCAEGEMLMRPRVVVPGAELDQLGAQVGAVEHNNFRKALTCPAILGPAES